MMKNSKRKMRRYMKKTRENQSASDKLEKRRTDKLEKRRRSRREADKKFREANREKRRESNRLYRAANKEKLLMRDRAYRAAMKADSQLWRKYAKLWREHARKEYDQNPDELPMLWHDEFFLQLSRELTNVMLKTMPEKHSITACIPSDAE